MELAWPYFAGLLPERAAAGLEIVGWFEKLLGLFVPAVDRLDQLPEKAASVELDPEAIRGNEENAALLSTESAEKVLEAFGERVLADAEAITPERFKAWMNEVKAETGVKGKELFHPVRIVLTGSHSGPEFDKLIPLIEVGSRLDLPAHIPSVRERVRGFLAA